MDTPVHLTLHNHLSLQNHESFQDLFHLYEQLKLKFKNQILKRAFSGHFLPCPSLEMGECVDIAISYSLSSLLILTRKEWCQTKIHVLDLHSKKLLFEMDHLMVASASRLCIEDNFDGNGNDALFFQFYFGGVSKIDLTKTLGSCKKGQDLEQGHYTIWRLKENSHDKAVKKGRSFKDNLVFTCQDSCIRVLSSFTGIPLQTILLDCTDGNPFVSCIDITPEGDLIISETGNNRIRIMREQLTSDNEQAKSEWQTIRIIGRSFGKEGNRYGEFSSPEDVLFDPVGQNIIVIDSRNQRIQVLNLYGRFVGVKNKYMELMTTHSVHRYGYYLNTGSTLCLNGLTGELFVCHRNRVDVFK
ncbi:hypothetical protein C9374_007154 [Naegleria lovaniensis]|uniref:Uncharacterized protein n=1 Tax=Naegleria lovaniensis TaxID=51637 RepID=A0AA88KPW0_NAELO|nr:uncharacterized protein C9374_007154 [Naegleria lovaniensis]KAG2393623.1 hypothetical protein C9374_007154 [Naegleria lovaniensis]